MKIKIIAIGQKMPSWVYEACDEYHRRFPRHFIVEIIEIPALPRHDKSDLQKIKNQEGERLLNACAPDDKIITLDLGGKPWRTDEVAQQLARWQNDGRDIALLIGGPEGLSDACKRRAEQSWCLSPLTLPHPLVRVVLLECLYRAWSINNNHPYHR